MNTVKVDKAELIKLVKANRDGHRKIFEEALAGYKKQAMKQLDAYIERIDRGDVIAVAFYVPVPEDHTDDYDRVLTMLDMSVDDTIEIDQNAFASYVMDDWQWKKQFLTTNSSYSKLAARALRKS
jgi:hypothetical protein